MKPAWLPKDILHVSPGSVYGTPEKRISYLSVVTAAGRATGKQEQPGFADYCLSTLSIQPPHL